MGGNIDGSGTAINTTLTASNKKGGCGEMRGEEWRRCGKFVIADSELRLGKIRN
jgi:hypothetical protein